MKTKTNKQLRIGITLGLMLGVSVYGTAWATPASTALPTGNTNVTGANTVTTSGNVMTVAQDKTVLNAQINWQTFNIGKNATVNFNQASTGSTMINNVVGNNMSEIAGKMNATGNIVLINPNGTTFYNGATINVGGLAVYAAKSTDLTSDANKLNEANIVIENGVTINAGISAAIAQATAMGIKPEELAIGIAANSNKIRLVANGNVTINDGAVLKALDSTTMSGYTAVGEEAFQLGGNANISTGEVIIRPDANANDYGTLTINGTPKVETTKASIFYNPTLVGTATTADGVTYNKKNYSAEQDFTTMMDTTAQTGVTDVKAQSGDSLKLVEAGGAITKEETRGITTKTASGASTAIARMLVNNVAQLQDIDTYINSTTENNANGNLAGKYALGKNIDAKSDSSSVVANGIVYAMSGGTVKAVSTQDSGQITSATTKTVLNNTVTLTYADSKVSSTTGFKYDGTTLSDGSNNTYKINSDGSVTETLNIGGTTITVTDPDTIATVKALPIALTELSSSTNQTNFTTYLGKTFSNMDSSKWPTNVAGDTGFDPIGNTTTNPFTGALQGFGGDSVHSISNLTINRPTVDNIGLIGVANDATLEEIELKAGEITGKNYVGGMAGQLLNGSSITWSSNSGAGLAGKTDATSGFVKVVKQADPDTGERTNIGGLAGYVNGSKISYSGNSATVIGQTDSITDLNVTKVGGVAGSAVNGADLLNVENSGNVFGEKETGGVVGYAEDSTVGSKASSDDTTAATFNRGQVTGTEDTAGIVGHGKGVTLYGVYNTNEDTALSTNSQLNMSPDGVILSRVGGSTAGVGSMIKDEAAQSAYGKITGATNTAGIVGLMEKGTTDSSIDTAYNAGNITGTTNTGGIVGQMTNGKITNAYNGDNNTVLRKSIGTVPEAVSGFNKKLTINGNEETFKYSESDAAYYSFYTTDGTTKTMYYFIPVEGKTSKGAGGIFINAAGNVVDVSDTIKISDASPIETKIEEADRFYLNRVGYKDANINGTTATGGIVGLQTDGSLATVYDLGTINKGVTGDTTGALVGSQTGGTIENSFYANNTDISTGKLFSGQDKAVGGKTDSGTVKGNTLAYWRERENIKKEFGTSFIGTMAQLDDASGYVVLNNGAYYYDAGGNIYGSDKTTPAFTAIGGIEFTGADKHTYTITKTLTNNVLTSITMTPKVAGEGTAVTMTTTPVASNQSDTWLVYEDQTTPLLKYFMNDNIIDRVFAYDGSTHNLKTDDVDNVYGRADFNDGKAGKNVKVPGYADSTEYATSSEYFYDTSSIWSPQHGYRLNPLASVIITPIALDANVTGERVYGDANTTTGYYVCVPYTETVGGTTKYAFYTVTGTGASTTYTLLEGTALTNFFTYNGTTYEQNETGIKQRAYADGHYVLTLNGILASEANTISEAVYDAVTAVKGATGDSGANLSNIFSSNATLYPYGDQSLDAGSYTMTTDYVNGLQAQYNDYTITYSGALTVDKAKLYYTYDGTKVYGDANTTGTHTYTLVGIDTNSTGTTGTSVNGYLKSFDSDKLTHTDKVLGGTVVGVTGTNAYAMTGTKADTSANITDTSTKAITQDTADTYYQVMVDANGNVLGYKLATLNTDADGANAATVTLTGTSTDNTAFLAKNYDFVWIKGGVANTVRQTNSSGVTTTDITAANSTETITPAELKLTVTGERQYGNLTDKTTYTTAQTKPTEGKYNVTGAATTTASSGLKAGNTLDGILNITNMTALVSGIEAAKDTDPEPTDQINEKTDHGTYDLLNGATLTKSNITVTTQNASKQYALLKTGNYNYTLVDGAHTETIDPRKVTIYTEATREYGNAPDDGTAGHTIGTKTTVTKFETTGSGMTSWDATKFSDNSATWQAKLTDQSKITDHVANGPYGTAGKADNAYITSGAVVLDSDTKTAITTAFGDNYAVTYADKLTLTQAPLTVTVTGERQYGANMPAATTYSTTDGTAAIPTPDSLTLGKYDINANGLKNSDTTAGILSAAGVQTKLGTVDSGDGNNTDTVGSHTNIGTYTGTSTVKFTLDNTNAIGTTNTILSSGDYYVAANGNNTLKIVKKPLTLTTTGSKTYDETSADPTDASKYNITTADLASWDSALLSNNKTSWIGLIDHKNTAKAVGTYGTNGTNNTDGYLTYATTDQNAIKSVLSNYDVDFKDLYTIGGKALTLYITGSRTYGAANSTLTKISFTAADGWADETDQNKYWTTENQTTWEGYYADTTDVNKTHVGTYGTKGSTDASNTYKTSGAITLTDEYKNNIKNTLSNYIITFDDQLTINPAPITVTVTGERTYGDNMTASNYTTSTAATAPTDTTGGLTAGKWNVNLSGLVGLDTATPSLALNDTALKGVLNNLDAGDGTATTTLGSHTNARATAYKLKGTDTEFTGTSLTITDSILKTQAQGGKDYTITNGDHDVKIDTRDVTITTKGSKVYGNADPATTSYTVDDTSAGSGLTSWDKTAYFTPNVDKWKNSITNSTDEATHHGTYGTKGTTGTTKVLDYAGTTTEANIANALNANGTTTNYNVTFEDLFTINKRQLTITTSGSKTYGDDNPAASALTIVADAATADTGLVDQNGNLATFNTYATGTGAGNWRSLVTDAATANTHVGTHGTNGTMDKSGILTYSDTNKNTISGNLDNDYDIKYHDLLTINKAQLIVTVTGERTYGDNMTASDYTTSNAATAPTDTTGGLTSGKWNVNLSGLKGTDTATVLSATNVNTILNALDSGDGNNTDTLGSHTNVGTYSMDATTPKLANTKVDLTNSILAEGDSGNYDIVDGAHQAKIDTKNVVVTTKGSKTYGDNDPTLTKDAVTESGLTSWDSTSYFTDANRTTWAGEVANSTDATSAAGLYGTVNVGKTGYKTSPVLTYTTDQQTAIKNAFNNNGTTSNYTVAFADDFTINKADLTLYTSGQKVYGDTATTTNLNTITGTGFKNSDAATLALAANQTTLKGYVDNAKAAAAGNHVGSYGTQGTDSTTAVLTYDSTEQGKISSLFGDNYTIAYTDKFEITPADLTVTVTGERNYGSSMTKDAYTTGTKVNGEWDVATSGLKNSETLTGIANGTALKTALNAIETTYAGDNTKLTNHTNAGTYALNGTALTGTNVALTQADVLAKNANGKYDYTVTNGNHQAKIDKIGVTITTKGSRIYGNENSTSTYTIDETGMTSWDKTNLYGTDGSSWKSGIDNSTTTATKKGVYGTLGNVTPKNAVLTYASGSKLATDLATNYDVNYADQFTITGIPLVITITGSKTYGDVTDLDVGKYTVSSTGLEGTDTLKYTGLINDVGLKADVGVYSKGNGADTTYGITALTGFSGFDTTDYDITYKTTYTINPRNLNIVTTGTKVYGDANPSSYTVSGLSGLASWESNKLTVATSQANLVNSTTEQTDVGNYGTQNGGAAVLTYNTDLQAAAGSNYKVNLADNFTITPRPITYSIEGTKDYGTGSEHTVYGTGSFTNVPDFAQATVNGNTAKDLVNTSNRTTNVGDYANSLLTVSHSGAWTKNYTITEDATLHVVPADFTYTSDHTSYWQYQHIPAQSGKVTNKYGEDVSDLVGTLSWPTPADGTVVGIFPVWGRGSNDNSGNYNVFQAAGNATALEVKNVPKTAQTNDALNENLEGAWRSFRRPILDIMYLKIKDNGFKSWDNGVFVTANPYVPAGDKTDYGIITFNGQALK